MDSPTCNTYWLNSLLRSLGRAVTQNGCNVHDFNLRRSFSQPSFMYVLFSFNIFFSLISESCYHFNLPLDHNTEFKLLIFIESITSRSTELALSHLHLLARLISIHPPKKQFAGYEPKPHQIVRLQFWRSMESWVLHRCHYSQVTQSAGTVEYTKCISADW